MNKNRLEAFSDGVLAIIITIMVLELRVPDGNSFSDLSPLLPVFGSYLLSFLYIGIYWGNHHHLLHTVSHVNGKILWANLHLLFWLSLIPFATSWMGGHHFTGAPVATYGAILVMCAMAYTILTKTIDRSRHDETPLTQALRSTRLKERVSLASYTVAIPLAFFEPLISCALFVAVAITWIVPVKAIEKAIGE